jgi:hypothetical protein
MLGWLMGTGNKSKQGENNIELAKYTEYIDNLTKEKVKLQELGKNYPNITWTKEEIVNLTDFIRKTTINKENLNKLPEGQQSLQGQEGPQGQEGQQSPEGQQQQPTSGGTRKKRKNRKHRKHKKKTLKH